MNIDKLIRKVETAHSPISLGEFERVAEHFGYTLDHVNGSHHVFRNWIGRKFVVPVRNRKIKVIYGRLFLKEQE